ncbi:WD40/YVTN/BNR-like repeat-containing protein [Mucilaginibacter agri]|uniref:Exo-alpha-sialidase n=1 Tax=Mucilaginibacter agri TaxID=2695265 RepID=A0A966DTW9_9SPHI|nr:hypothetical protein [Mucilaginibacter agri]NCD71738.1 hypothetical protein [Mucilaginibacter agri]
MKKILVFVPGMLLVLFLLNSFVLRERQEVLKSTDGGQTWEDGSLDLAEIKKPVTIVQSGGVLIATGSKGIRRSTDNGEHWQWVISEGGVGIAVERIEGGFAAISYNAETKSRRIRISLDKGKTWQAIDEGLQTSPFISSIKQMGKYFICGDTDGIFRSSDMGKTWMKVHPGVDKNDFVFIPILNKPVNKPKNVFRIYASGDVLYAVAGSAGC